MDYEKKYNEAMLRADEAVQKGCLDKDMFDIIFPPEESEDERIRKWLVDYFGSIKDVVWIHQDITCEQILSYLEKQKEQKHPHGCFTCDEYKKGYEAGRLNGFTAGYNKAMKEMEQKEQKPVEKQDYSGLNDLERAIHRGFLVAGVENVPVTIIKETAQDCLAHLPVEWSEEDEEMIQEIIGSIDTMIAASDFHEMENWLKSLRPQPQGVYKQIVHSIYKMLKGKDFYGMPTSNCISLLNDIRVKCKDADECAEILDEPSWKPTEEHLSALLAVFNDPNNIGSQTCQLALTDLYEQLKKL